MDEIARMALTYASLDRLEERRSHRQTPRRPPVSSAQIDVHEKNPLKSGVKTRKESHEGAQRL
jgi:hypothetical protein